MTHATMVRGLRRPVGLALAALVALTGGAVVAAPASADVQLTCRRDDRDSHQKRPQPTVMARGAYVSDGGIPAWPFFVTSDGSTDVRLAVRQDQDGHKVSLWLRAPAATATRPSGTSGR